MRTNYVNRNKRLHVWHLLLVVATNWVTTCYVSKATNKQTNIHSAWTRVHRVFDIYYFFLLWVLLLPACSNMFCIEPNYFWIILPYFCCLLNISSTWLQGPPSIIMSKLRLNVQIDKMISIRWIYFMMGGKTKPFEDWYQFRYTFTLQSNCIMNYVVSLYIVIRSTKIVPLKCYFLIKFQDIGRKSLSLIWWACHVLATWIEFSARGGMYHHATVKTCRSWKFFRPCNIFLEQ